MDKRVLAISDMSCMGQCSLGVALPIISAAGVETCALPTTLLSTHTVGFDGYFKADVTDMAEEILAHWKKTGVRFDVVLIGYLGSIAAAELAEEAICDVCLKDAKIVLDPAMADEGRLYPELNDAYVEKIKKLCAKADFILPNLSEARLLTGLSEDADTDALFEALKKLTSADIVITGVNKGSSILTEMRGKTHRKFAEAEYIERQFHGAGDVFAAAFTGALAAGISADDSFDLAVRLVEKSIAATLPFQEHWYGLKFEQCLAEYAQRVKLLSIN